MYKKLLVLQKKIRTAFENLAKRAGMSSHLGGYCRRASVQLLLIGRELGKEIQIAASDHHCFNIYKGYIIDITATQFGKKRSVWVVKASPRNLRSYWRPRTLRKYLNPFCNSVSELFSKAGWFSPKNSIYKDKRFVKKYIEE